MRTWPEHRGQPWNITNGKGRIIEVLDREETSWKCCEAAYCVCGGLCCSCDSRVVEGGVTEYLQQLKKVKEYANATRKKNNRWRYVQWQYKTGWERWQRSNKRKKKCKIIVLSSPRREETWEWCERRYAWCSSAPVRPGKRWCADQWNSGSQRIGELLYGRRRYGHPGICVVKKEWRCPCSKLIPLLVWISVKDLLVAQILCWVLMKLFSLFSSSANVLPVAQWTYIRWSTSEPYALMRCAAHVKDFCRLYDLLFFNIWTGYFCWKIEI